MINFKRLTPIDEDAKDSCSFTFKDENYMMCTNCKKGGILVLKEDSNGDFITYDKLFEGWTWVWAPTIFKEHNQLYIYFSDTEGRDAHDTISAANASRLLMVRYNVETKKISSPTKVKVGDDSFGLIDPYVKLVDNIYFMLYVNVKRHTIKKYASWLPKFLAKLFRLYDEDDRVWDIYYATSDRKEGPFTNPRLLVPPETIIEEAPFWPDFDPDGDFIYWSEKPSDMGSYVKRGRVVVQGKKLVLHRDSSYKLEWDNTITTTHPDFFDGKIRATLKTEESLFYIGEKV